MNKKPYGRRHALSGFSLILPFAYTRQAVNRLGIIGTTVNWISTQYEGMSLVRPLCAASSPYCPLVKKSGRL